jgi:hypothetical protein
VKEPRRLLIDSETSAFSRSLLTAGRVRREPEGARERVWGAIAVTVASSAAATGSVAAGTSAGVKGGGTVLALTKAKVIFAGAVIAIVAGGTAAVMQQDARVAAAVRSAPVIEPAVTTATANTNVGQRSTPDVEPPPPLGTSTETEPNVETRWEAQTSRTSARSGVPGKAGKAGPKRIAAPETTKAPVDAISVAEDRADHVPPASALSKLREEAALLQEVRAALARHDAATARSKLDEARRRYPQSQLAHERDALEVRLASERGDLTRTASLARAFVERYPDSPLRSKMETMARPPEKL